MLASFPKKIYDLAKIDSKLSASLGTSPGIQARTVSATTSTINPGVGNRSVINGDFYSRPYLIAPNYVNWVWSSSPADDTGGIGASLIRVFGYADRDSEDMTSSDTALLGTRVWGFPEQFYRVEFAQIIEFGNAGNQANFGTITITTTSNGEPTAATQDAIFIRPFENISHYSGFWVPAGKVAVILSVKIRNTQDVTSSVILESRSEHARSVLDRYLVRPGDEFNQEYSGTLILSRSDVQLVVEDVSAPSQIYGSISYLLVDESMVDFDNISFVPGTR